MTGTQEEEWPKEWTAFNVHYTVRGRGVDSKAVHRAIELSEGKYCSVGATLKGTADDHHVIRDRGGRRLGPALGTLTIR